MKYWMLSAGLLLAIITGCVIDLRPGSARFGFFQTHRQTTRQLTLDLPDTDPQAPMPASLTGTWRSSGDWTQESPQVSIQIQIKKDAAIRQTGVWMNETEIQAASTDIATRYEIDRPAGILTINGDIRTGASGDFVFTPRQTWLEALDEVLDQTPDTGQFIDLWASAIDLTYARALKEALGDRLDLAALLTLGRHGVPSDYVATLNKQGYDFSVDDIVKLRRHGISSDYAGSYKEAGYSFDAEALIQTNRYGLRAAQFEAFREAGYDFDIDTMIKANRYGINPDEANRFREAGYDLSLDDLIEIDRYGLRPEQFIRFREAGYDFDIDTMIKANRYGINPDQAARFRQAGYAFTLDELIELSRYGIGPEFAAPLKEAGYRFSVAELIELSRYGISTEYIVALADPDYETFTAAEIISMKNNGVSAATLKKIRQKKPVPQPDAPR